MDLLDEMKISNLYLVGIKSEQERVAEEKLEDDRSPYTPLSGWKSSHLTFFCFSGAYREKALHWLFPGDPEEKHKDTRKKRWQGTGEWFFETEEFQDWVREPSSWLFCHGKRTYPTLIVVWGHILTGSWCIAGAGKSVLT